MEKRNNIFSFDEKYEEPTELNFWLAVKNSPMKLYFITTLFLGVFFVSWLGILKTSYAIS